MAQLSGRMKRLKRKYLEKHWASWYGGNFCYYCKETLVIKKYDEATFPTGKDATLDHLVPFAKGGRNDLKNIVLFVI